MDDVSCLIGKIGKNYISNNGFQISLVFKPLLNAIWLFTPFVKVTVCKLTGLSIDNNVTLNVSLANKVIWYTDGNNCLDFKNSFLKQEMYFHI